MYTVEKKPFMVSASVSCMNQCYLADEIRKVEASDVSFFHFDIVDGHFNKCFILGEATLEHMRKITDLPIEVHLAVDHPEWYAERFIKLGADYLAVQYEALSDPLKFFNQIRKWGAEPVLAFKSTTPPDENFAAIAKESPWILKLTVNPGFSGQTLQPNALAHIRQMSGILAEQGIKTPIQADGNINPKTIPSVVAAGATILTGGTSGLFVPGKTVAENASAMLELAEKSIK